MECKLIKYHYGFEYFLMDEKGETIATLESGKLSLKNCQVIELGYDLDDISRDFDYSYDTFATSCFKDGFQKALEILSDKKFSIEDIQNVIDSNEDSLSNRK